MAATNKFLAQINKSGPDGEATNYKKRDKGTLGASAQVGGSYPVART